MQAAISAISQEMSGATLGVDKISQLLSTLLQLLRHQKPSKPDIPPGTVATISSVLCHSQSSSGMVQTCLKCLQHVVHLLPNAPPVLRLEGGLRAMLMILQSPVAATTTVSLSIHLLGQLSAASSVTLAALIDLGALPVLMNTLDLYSTNESLSCAALQLLVLASKTPRGAVKLSELQLVPLVARMLALHESSSSVCGAALKLLRRVAKQPPCQGALLAAGAVQFLLDAAHRMAAVEGQQQQVKRASRAIWLLCPSSFTPLPAPEPSWSLPSRSAPHLNLGDAMGNDVQRLQELFPELQAAFAANQAVALPVGAHHPAQSLDTKAVAGKQPLLKAAVQSSVQPPSVAELLQHKDEESEPFHPDNSHLAVTYMLQNLSRLQNLGGLTNPVVFDSAQPPPVSLQRLQEASSSSAPNCVELAPLGRLQFTSAFESGNLRMAVQVQDTEYDLFLSNDVNDRSPNSNTTQWFYFGVWNAQPGTTYKLNLVNFSKPSSLYTSCKRPLMCQAGSIVSEQQEEPDSCQDGKSNSASVVQTMQQPAVESSAPEARVGEAQPEATTAAAGCRTCKGGATCTATQHLGSGSSASSWFRTGHNVCYYASPYRGRGSTDSGSRPAVAPSSAEKESPAGSNGANNNGNPGSASGKKVRSNSIKKSPKKKSQVGPATSVSGKQSSGSRRSTAEVPAAPSVTPAAADSSNPAEGSSNSQQQAVDSNGLTQIANTAAPGPGLYCLTFEVTFPCSGMYLICNCYPYTYSDLQQQLAEQQLRFSRLLPAPAPLVWSLLCYTLAGQRCDLLTITDFSSSAAELAGREYVLVTARVHPGETCASWIMQGIMDFLLSSDPLAQRLRQYFVFKLVPMLNPDGVVVGNYRSSLAGVDLNRCWDKPLRDLHPTIFHTRKLLEALAEPGRLALTIDLHGHSIKTDAFFYGCEPVLTKPSKAEQADMKAAAVAAAESGANEAAGKSNSVNSSSCNGSSSVGISSGMEQLSISGRSYKPRGSRSRKTAEMSEACMHLQHPPGSGAIDSAGASVPGTAQAGEADAVCAVQAVTESESSTVQQNTELVAISKLTDAPAIDDNNSSSANGSAGAQVAAMSPAAVARLRVRMLPYLAAQAHPGFNLSKCSFKVQKNIAGTARVVAARQLGIPGAYTLEASLAGCSTTNAHFKASDYLNLGRSLMVAVGQLAEADDSTLLSSMACTVKMSALPGHPASGNV